MMLLKRVELAGRDLLVPNAFGSAWMAAYRRQNRRATTEGGMAEQSSSPPQQSLAGLNPHLDVDDKAHGNLATLRPGCRRALATKADRGGLRALSGNCRTERNALSASNFKGS
jgi:hypothetical protein